jgi:release factor glutamine methyltransferase
LNQVRQILSGNPMLVSRGWVESEARQILKMSDGIAGQDRAISAAIRRSRGEPLQYILGHQAFLDHFFEVGPGVLVPRPETEFLVDLALRNLAQNRPAPGLGAEVGLGSGAISVSLVANLQRLNPEFKMIATEVSEAAIAIAERNARAILKDSSSRIEVRKPASPIDVLGPFSEKFDFLISNPPYLVEGDPIDGDVRTHEPAQALFAPAGDPLHFYREIADHGLPLLKPGGTVFCEIPSFRSKQIRENFESRGWRVEVHQDLAGEDRVLVARAARNSTGKLTENSNG